MEKHSNFNISGKTEERFGMYFLLFRISGVSFMPHNYPNIYMLYAMYIVLSAHVTVLAIILDVLQHTDDLQYCMSGIQMICAITLVIWIHLFIRYGRTNISKFLSFCCNFAFAAWGISLHHLLRK
jgi:chromate transport protein ChrA